MVKDLNNSNDQESTTTSLIPSINGVYDVGSSSFRWDQGYINNLISQAIAANTLTPAAGTSITPSTTLTLDFGTTSNRWRNVVSQTITGDNAFEVRSSRNSYGEFSSGGQTITVGSPPGTYQKITITLTGYPNFDPGNNEIGFPYKGFYMFNFTLSYDTNLLSVGFNYLQVRIRRLSPSLASQYQEIVVGSNGSTVAPLPPRTNFTFKFEVSDTADRIVLEAVSTNDPVTNVRVQEGFVALLQRFR